VLKEAVGCQDQTIAAFGGLALIEFNSDGSITRSDVVISKEQMERFNKSFTLVYTGIQRRAALVEVDKIKNFSANQENLSALKKMAYVGKQLLERGDCFEEFGEMLHEAWMRKRCLSDNVSNIAIDTIYEDGLNSGAFGGKLLGAGAGGFILFCHDQNKRDEFRFGMRKYKVVDIKFVESGVEVLGNV
jgi:D-glycero-alpha-D-manno-heptose-7-phosphate kinase